jgi:hypothetical protein
MNNTQITIKFPTGEVRQYTASAELESMIEAGDVFSVVGIHPSQGEETEKAVCRMYCGNPVAALGHMLHMRNNAEELDEDEHPGIVMNVFDHCINLLKSEITSHDSGMTTGATTEDSNLAFGVFMPVIEYASTCDEPQAFLKLWMDGDLTTIAEEWPDFEIAASMLREPSPVDQKPALKLVSSDEGN